MCGVSVCSMWYVCVYGVSKWCVCSVCMWYVCVCGVCMYVIMHVVCKVCVCGGGGTRALVSSAAYLGFVYNRGLR